MSAVLGAAVLIACDVREPTAQGGRPDIVLVSIDSLRYDHLGCYGYERPTSPTIDGFAREGVLFRNAVSTTSWTLPAHAALFTGLYDSAHGLVDNGLRLADAHVTLAEALGAAGYQTGGFYGGPYLHSTFGLGQGFDSYQSCMTALADDLPDADLRATAQAPRSLSHEDVTGPRTVLEVESWLGRTDERPLFLFVHLWDVHFDYVPPPPYVEMFDPDYEGDLDARGLMQNQAVHRGMRKRDREHLLALYDGEIRFTDDTLAAIFEALRARGRYESSLVVVTADHGEEFFEHGGKGHQRTLFDELIRVPLIVRWPGKVLAGEVVEQQVRLIDMMPTLLSLAGIPPPGEMQGRDLSPLLRGETLPPEPTLAELLVGRRLMRALRTDEHKLISYANRRFALFDLVRDPGELKSQRAGAPGAARAKKQLGIMLKETLSLAERIQAGGAETAVPDPDLRERLDALGYLDGGD
jgi:arylsulfatase A-like enzyme